MKAKIFKPTGDAAGELALPSQFSTPLRVDLIRRAVRAIWRNSTQPYGAKPMAGRTSSAVFRGIRRGYGRSYNWSLARLPRLMVRGGRRIGRVVNVPQAVGGPRAHPPKAEKVWTVRLNNKERRLAIRSALAATVNPELVLERGHKLPSTYPIILSSEFESISRTKELLAALEKLGLGDELERAARKKVRAGRGKSRGRKYKRAKGPLIVVSGLCPLTKAASNIPGVDVVVVNYLNAAQLAPGAHPGRLTLFTEQALRRLKEEKLFF